MPNDRDSAIERARSAFYDGSFVERLTELVACPTECQVASRRGELYRYCTHGFGPLLRSAGFEIRMFDNPRREFGPFLIGTRIENPSLPAMLIYGHGDVVRAMPERWRQGLDPWRLTIEGDRIYGRGTVDNKGEQKPPSLALLRLRWKLLFVKAAFRAGVPSSFLQILSADAFQS
jgi:acetylornithine deacetylase/succinyl-diaminopimelate desuccinylase-like protein